MLYFIPLYPFILSLALISSHCLTLQKSLWYTSVSFLKLRKSHGPFFDLVVFAYTQRDFSWVARLKSKYKKQFKLYLTYALSMDKDVRFCQARVFVISSLINVKQLVGLLFSFNIKYMFLIFKNILLKPPGAALFAIAYLEHPPASFARSSEFMVYLDYFKSTTFFELVSQSVASALQSFVLDFVLILTLFILIMVLFFCLIIFYLVKSNKTLIEISNFFKQQNKTNVDFSQSQTKLLNHLLSENKLSMELYVAQSESLNKNLQELLLKLELQQGPILDQLAPCLSKIPTESNVDSKVSILSNKLEPAIVDRFVPNTTEQSFESTGNWLCNYDPALAGFGLELELKTLNFWVLQSFYLKNAITLPEFSMATKYLSMDMNTCPNLNWIDISNKINSFSLELKKLLILQSSENIKSKGPPILDPTSHAAQYFSTLLNDYDYTDVRLATQLFLPPLTRKMFICCLYIEGFSHNSILPVTTSQKVALNGLFNLLFTCCYINDLKYAALNILTLKVHKQTVVSPEECKELFANFQNNNLFFIEVGHRITKTTTANTRIYYKKPVLVSLAIFLVQIFQPLIWKTVSTRAESTLDLKKKQAFNLIISSVVTATIEKGSYRFLNALVSGSLEYQRSFYKFTKNSLPPDDLIYSHDLTKKIKKKKKNRSY